LGPQIVVRLPAPEADFQAGRLVTTRFLSEVITSEAPDVNDALTECIILATLGGRALSHRHQSLVETLYVNTSEDFWSRHRYIHTTLSRRLEALSSNYTCHSQHADPMLLFTCMMAQTTVLHLQKLIEEAWPAIDQSDAAVAESMRVSLVAAQEVVKLTKMLSQISFLKVAAFQPCLLSAFWY